MNNESKRWFLLNPEDFKTMWWKNNDIISIQKSELQRTIQDSLAHIIIQDGNIGGKFWYFSSWYNDDPNRYSSTVFSNNWPFNKELTNMIQYEVVYLIDFPDVLFTVYYCKFGIPFQNKYCKILERIPSQIN
jgi:hypothetical protein